MDILNKIKKMQKERGWNDSELAEHAKINQSTIASMYKRNNLPTIPTLISICEGFGITIAQFFAECDVPPDLTKEQIELLEHWNTIDDEQKEALMLLLKRI